MLTDLYEIEDDLTEKINISLNDKTLEEADCHIIAYNCRVSEDESDLKSEIIYNPKKNPDKAVIIKLDYPENDLTIEIFLDTPSKQWDSMINGTEGKLSPEQMGEFFKSNFYHEIKDKLLKMWPKKDEYFSELISAIQNNKIRIDNNFGLIDEESGSNQFGTGKVDINKSREKNAAGEQIRTRSGRKYIEPSDFMVRHDKNEAYYCWPDSKGKGEFKWSNWADWRKLKPLCRIRWNMGHIYGLSISPLEEKNENRGFRAYDLTAQPPLQYLTPEETQEICKLSIIQKFLKNVKKRLMRYLSMEDEDIFKKIGRPDKCTLDDIRQTKKAVRNALDAIRNSRADTYIYN